MNSKLNEMKVYIWTFTLVLCTGVMSAQLSIDASAGPSSSGACDGTVNITAGGNAGPFDLIVSSSGSNDTLGLSQAVQGSGLLSGLCAGTYDVYAHNRFGCSHSLGSVTIGGGSNFAPEDITKSNDSPKQNTVADVSVSDHPAPQIRAFPNPFAQDVTIRIQAYAQDNYQIQIYDVVGQKVYDKSVSVQKGINDFMISDIRGTSSGIYLVHVLNDDKSIIESLRVFKIESGGQDDDDDD